MNLFYNSNYKDENDIEGIKIRLVKLDNTVIPGTPFLWYREEQLICPIEHICKKYFKTLKYLNFKTELQDDDELFVIVQRNVLENSNIYVCLHSLLYCKLVDEKDDILVISPNFNHSVNFNISTDKLEDFTEVHGGLKKDDIISGPVCIHDCSFSPPGCFHFKLPKEQAYTIFYCSITCSQLNISLKCLFFLINDISQNCNMEIINDMIKKN
jgi:hypothetical protein